MIDKLKKRLATLKTEFEAGQKGLAAIDIQRRTLQEALLCITGAIRVLEELLAPSKG